MSRFDLNREYCEDCSRGRAYTCQKRQTASVRAKKEKAETEKAETEKAAAYRSKKTEKACEVCQVDLGLVHHLTKYCEQHRLEKQNEQRRINMRKAREKIINQGETA